MISIADTKPLSLVERAAWDRYIEDSAAAYSEAQTLLAQAIPSLAFRRDADADAPDLTPGVCRALVREGVPSPYELAKNALAATHRRKVRNAMSRGRHERNRR